MKIFKDSEKKQVYIGTILSYITIFANSIYGFVIAPFVLSTVGDSDYGVYQTIASLANSLMIIDVGLGATLVKYTAEYRAKGELFKIAKLLKTVLNFSVVISICVIALIIYIYAGFDKIYGSTFNDWELGYAKTLVILFGLNMVLMLFDDLLAGIIGGLNRLVVSNGIRFSKVFLRYVFILVLLPFVKSTILIIYLNIALTIAFMFVEFLYARPYLKNLEVREYVDDSVNSKQILVYSFYIFAMAIVNQVNGNLDNVIIGAEMGAAFVTIYSFALTIFSAYDNISSSISKNLLPTVTNITYNNPEHIEPFISKVGRVQFMLMGAVLFCFAVIGKDFVILWLGERFTDVYYISLILLIPSTLELCVNTCLAMLRALNKLGFRTIVLTITTIVNALITVIGVKIYGYYAASVGTAFSVIVGSVLIMNIYYYKKLNINILRVYYNIFHGTIDALLIASIPTWILNHYLCLNWVNIIIQGFCFMLVYVACLFIFGLNCKEKQTLLSMLKAINNR